MSGRALAVPLSMLHRACFPEEPWEPRAMAKIMAMAGFFGWIAWEDDDPVGFALALDLGDECEILALGVVPGLAAGRDRNGACSRRSATRRCGAACDSVLLEVAADNVAARALYAA